MKVHNEAPGCGLGKDGEMGGVFSCSSIHRQVSDTLSGTCDITATSWRTRTSSRPLSVVNQHLM